MQNFRTFNITSLDSDSDSEVPSYIGTSYTIFIHFILQHYEHLVLPVWFSNSKDPENYGVCQYCVPALTYIAQNDWTETGKINSRLPSLFLFLPLSC